MSSLDLDLRQAARGLLRRPSFAIVAALTLGVATGAVSAVFAVVDAALLAPLPFAEAERLVRVYERDVNSGRPYGQVAIADYRDWRDAARRLQGLAVSRFATATLTGRGDATRLAALRVSAGWFDVLGVAPALGRGFGAQDGAAGAPRVALISHGAFERAFGANAALVGTAVTLDATPTTIVGVLPASFRSPVGGEADVFLADDFEALARDPNRARRMHAFAVIARLAPEASLEQAQDEMGAIGRRLEALHPRDNAGHQPDVVPLRAALTRTAAPMLEAASAAVLLLLLLAAVNVAGLALARSLSRQHDVALRAALGARGAGLLRVPLLESLLVAAAGGVVGVLIATWGASALATLAGPVLAPSGAPVSWRLLVFGGLAAAVAGVVSGLAPAVAAARVDLVSVVKAGAAGATPGGSRLRLRGALVGAQVALACVLLVGCGLLLRSMSRLGDVDPGFDPDGVTTFATSTPRARYGGEREVVAAQDAVRERLASQPGVGRVAVAYTLPFSNLSTTSLVPVGAVVDANAPAPEVGYNSVGPDYFEALGIPLVRGRFFEAGDSLDSAPVVIVNRALADAFFPGQDPIGRGVRAGSDASPVTIVGVVGNVLRAGLDDAPAPELFYCARQDVTPSPLFVVKAEPAAQAALAETVRRAVRAVDPDLPVYAQRPLAAIVATTVAPRRLLLILLSGFGSAALLLAGLGVFGVASQLVVQRRREIAVRLALGARGADVRRLVLSRGLTPVVAGLATGAVAAWLATRLIEAMLFGVTATDPLTYAAVLAALLGTATVACLLPAWRAVTIAPSEILRGD